MLGQKDYLASELVADQPVVVVLCEEKSDLVLSIRSLLLSHGLRVKIYLFNELQDAEQKRQACQQWFDWDVYKVLVVGGFQVNYWRQAAAVKRLLADLQQIALNLEFTLPWFFLLNYSTPLDVVGLQLSAWQRFYLAQQDFLDWLLEQFPQANLVLIEDFLGKGNSFSPRFELLFAAWSKNLLIDTEFDYFWQDKGSLFCNLPRLLFQSSAQKKYLLRGRKLAGSDFFASALSLSKRYHQKSFQALHCSAQLHQSLSSLPDLLTVYEDNQSALKLLDDKIRQLPESLLLNEKNLIDSLVTLNQRQKTNPQSSSSSPSSAKNQALKNSELVLNKTPKTSVNNQLTKIKSDSNEPHHLLSQSPIKQVVAKKQSQFKKEKTDESVNIDKRLQKIFQDEQHQRQSQRFEDNLKGVKNIVHKSKKRRLVFYLGVGLSSIAILLLSLVLSFYLSKNHLQRLIFKQSQQLTAQKQATDPDIFKTGLVYRFFSWQLSLSKQLFGQDQFSTAQYYQELYDHFSQRQQLRLELNALTFTIYQQLLGTMDDQNLSTVDLQRFLDLRTQFLDQEKQIATLLKNINPELLSKDKQEQLIDLSAYFNRQLVADQHLNALLAPLLDLISSPARSNLLLLVQDNSELRSSGGLLTNLVTFSLESGQLVDWQVYDVSELDGRVYGEKMASQELQDLFDQDKLLLRDANWPADFTQAMTDIIWFVEQSLSIQPDLLMTINLQQLQTLLAELGPLQVDGLEINQRNLLVKVHDQQALSSKQLLTTLVERLMTLQGSELLFTSQFYLQQLENKESFLLSPDQGIQQVLSNNVWTGSILDAPCPAEFAAYEQCFTDGIYQVENNIGLNKSNRLISEQIEHNLGISEHFIRHKRSIQLQNLSRQNLWPEGDYQAYFKFYLPITTQLEKIMIDGQILDATRYQIRSINDKQLLSMRLTVPANTGLTLEIIYLVPHQLSGNFAYVFLDQKQAGLTSKHTVYRVVFAEQFQPQLIAPSATYQDKIIEFNNDNQDHFLFAVAF